MTDDEIINAVLMRLYNDGMFLTGWLHHILQKCNIETTTHQYYAIIGKMRLERVVEITDTRIIQGAEKKDGFMIDLSDEAKKIIIKHKSYLKYLSYLEKKERSKRINKKWKRILSYVTGVVAIVATIATLILAILSGIDQKERTTLTKELQRTATERDSLKQVLSTQQKPPDTLRVKPKPER